MMYVCLVGWVWLPPQANLNYSRDHSIAEGLDYMTTWNMAALQVRTTSETSTKLVVIGAKDLWLGSVEALERL